MKLNILKNRKKKEISIKKKCSYNKKTKGSLQKLEIMSSQLEKRIRDEENMATTDQKIISDTSIKKKTENPQSRIQLEASDVTTMKERIENNLEILRNFKRLRQEDRSRSDYVQQLFEDFYNFYGYNEELMTIFLELFSPDETKSFLEANENKRPVTLRTNTLMTGQTLLMKALKDRGISLGSIGDWTPVGIKVYNSRVPVGATPEYLAGHYILQSPSSLLPVMALNPKSTDRILDMCSAPGGKTTHIAQLMKNQGLIIANDISRQRLSCVVSNLHRLGVSNCLIINMSGLKLPHHFNGFNKILLDAPCTGLGVISRDETIKQNRTLEDIYKLSQVQKQLILSAIDMLEDKSGEAVLVYSTCSISVQENEDVIAFALKKRFVRIEETGLTFGVSGFKRFKEKRFPSSMSKTRRFYPHVHNMDGFFISKLVKFKKGTRTKSDEFIKKTESSSEF